MNLRSGAICLLTISFFAVLTGCRKWDDHISISDPSLKENLYQKMQAMTELSKFNELLVKTGYDTVLSSAKLFTVWAPDNQALASLDPAVVNDNNRLRLFVANHIGFEEVYSTAAARVKTLNGKFINISGTGVEGATISKANQVAGNGVLHIINKMIVPKPNVWEYVNSTSYKQKDYMLSLNYQAIDSSKAEVIGVDANTGKPIFKPGTGLVQKNHLFEKSGNLENEEKLYTFILLTDAALEAERTKMKPFTKARTADSTEMLASLQVIKDFVFEGVYTLAQMPDTLVSAEGVKVGFDKSAVKETISTSNGIVYVMDRAAVRIQDKVMTIRREGEQPTGFSQNDKSGNISYRFRKNPNTGELFNDLYIFNHKIPLFHVKYSLKNVYSGKYKIYWVAPNDVQTLTFRQRLAINDFNSTLFPETNVPLKNYAEVEIGEYTVNEFGNLDLYVIAANNGVDGTNSINIDYIKLVPQ